jgi:hypothetical protein
MKKLKKCFTCKNFITGKNMQNNICKLKRCHYSSVWDINIKKINIECDEIMNSMIRKKNIDKEIYC